jgi:hypothetical protein
MWQIKKGVFNQRMFFKILFNILFWRNQIRQKNKVLIRFSTKFF